MSNIRGGFEINGGGGVENSLKLNKRGESGINGRVENSWKFNSWVRVEEILFDTLGRWGVLGCYQFLKTTNFWIKCILWILIINRNKMKLAYKLASLHQLTKQNTIKTDGSFCEIAKKMSISILFQKVRLRWKLSPIINRRGVGISMSWVEKNRKIN